MWHIELAVWIQLKVFLVFLGTGTLYKQCVIRPSMFISVILRYSQYWFYYVIFSNLFWFYFNVTGTGIGSVATAYTFVMCLVY